MRLPLAAALEPRLARLVPWMALVTLLLWSPLVLHADHSWDDADPEVLNNAFRLAQGEPLYHPFDGPPWVVNPYTPLYHALVAAGLKITGLSYYPARLVSVMATGALAAAFVVLSRRWRGRARDGLWAVCLLVLVPAFLYNLARPHPQMLAVALSVWSFVLFESPRPAVANVLSPLLAVFAVYAKQTQIVLPLALVVWLLWRDRSRIPLYAGALALFGLVPAVCLELATRGAFLECIFDMNLLPYRAWQIAPVLIHQAGPLWAFLWLAVIRFRSRLPALEPIDFYCVAVALATIPSLGRVGAHGQYVLEMLVTTVIYLLRTGGLGFSPGRNALGVAQLAGLLLYAPSFVLLEEGPFARQSIAAAPSVRALLQTEGGPVISQQGSFSLFTRGEIHVQLFHCAALARMGRWNQQPLIRDVEERKPAWVVTESPLEQPVESDDDWERFTPELRDALARSYVRQAKIGLYYVYRRR
jgi:dolichyl-phosphate-mannose-protein mannosyltransferase